MSHFIFIVNPVSGSGKREEVLKQIEEKFKPDSHTIRMTEYAGHAIEIAREYRTQNNCIVVAVGGDGSINEVAQGLTGSETSMGVIPVGSGNGLARHLSIPLDVPNALDNLIHGHSITMDVGRLNGHLFAVTCGIGFDAEVSYNFAQRSSRGLMGYVQESLALFPKYECKKYHIQLGEKVIETQAFSISIANASQYGNNAYIAKDAKVNDGQLELCIIEKYPFFMAPFIGLSLFTKSLHRSKYYRCIPLQEARLKVIGADKKIKAQIDGEALEIDQPVEVKIEAANLNIVVPKS